MKICPKCRQSPKDPKLIVCQECHEPFIDASDATLLLSPGDITLIARRLARLGRFWLYFAAGLVPVLVLIWGLVGFIAKWEAKRLFNAEMANQIKLQFQEPRISNIIVSVAQNLSSNLMITDITPEINKFKLSLAHEFKSETATFGTLTSTGPTFLYGDLTIMSNPTNIPYWQWQTKEDSITFKHRANSNSPYTPVIVLTTNGWVTNPK
jgi:hypothetical protein